MKHLPSFDEILRVMSAASGGDLSARVFVPKKASPDIPEVRLAIALNLLLDDLAGYTETLSHMNAELAESNKELEQFAYVASHDLQEPLRMVSSYMQLLQARYKDRLDADAQEFIGYAVDGAVRMQRLIQDLLAFSRVGTRGKQPEAVDSEAALLDAVQNLKMQIESEKAVIVFADLPVVMADRDQLTQVFQNLISNSIKFRGNKKPHIGIDAQVSNGFAEFKLVDNGIGIDPKYAERIFVIFQRLHSREEFEGTGIGLAICKKIIERHGGRIWVDSDLGNGSSFYFTLPIMSKPPKLEQRHLGVARR
jgi:chemotaxis family two-component system sensor kinase Cph1